MMVTIAESPLGLHVLDALPKGNTFNTEYYCVNIITELRPLRPQGDGRRLVIHADNVTPHTTRKYPAFAKKVGSTSPYTHHTHLISHHRISFSSDISTILCRESFFHRLKNYLQQFMKSSRPSRNQLWRTCFGTGWKHSNKFLRTMVMTIQAKYWLIFFSRIPLRE
jgi:hypothetical protein